MNSEAQNHSSPATSSQLNCSVCGEVFQMDQTTSPPFCSERCKLVDLGRWMNEEIGLPHEGGPTKGEAVERGEEIGDEGI